MHFNRFDICAAYNMFSMMYGSDQVKDRYTNAIRGRLERFKYRPSRSEEYIQGLSENAKEIYAALVRRHYADEVALFRFYRRYCDNHARENNELARYLAFTGHARIWREAGPRELDAIDCYRPEARQ